MNSLSFFKISGIEIRVHKTFLLLPAVFALFYGYSEGPLVGLRAATLVLLVFASVVMHELSHSFLARRYGIRVPYIVLYPIGGVANMQRIPRNPRQEFLISLVGPLSNFVLAAALYFPFYYLLGPEDLFSPGLDSWPRTLANFLWINPILGFFNLLPAFPMDGGRILRSLLASRMDYAKATRISVFFGHVFAILFFLLGIWKKHWMLVLIAFFIAVSASEELARQRAPWRLENDKSHS